MPKADVPNVNYIPTKTRNALVVHPDLGALSAMQAALSQKGIVSILARDLPTALLAITQHRFDLCITSASVSEKGDGFALAGVLRMCFPQSFLAVIAPQPDLGMLQTAINSGVTQLYLDEQPAAANAEAILRDYLGQSGSKLQ